MNKQIRAIKCLVCNGAAIAGLGFLCLCAEPKFETPKLEAEATHTVIYRPDIDDGGGESQIEHMLALTRTIAANTTENVGYANITEGADSGSGNGSTSS
jgi:hypothetical protein